VFSHQYAENLLQGDDTRYRREVGQRGRPQISSDKGGDSRNRLQREEFRERSRKEQLTEYKRTDMEDLVRVS
jgi:hypothetical protein